MYGDGQRGLPLAVVTSDFGQLRASTGGSRPASPDTGNLSRRCRSGPRTTKDAAQVDTCTH